MVVHDSDQCRRSRVVVVHDGYLCQSTSRFMVVHHSYLCGSGCTCGNSSDDRSDDKKLFHNEIPFSFKSVWIVI